MQLQVLDRVLTNFGGRHWWTSLSSRIKTQRMYTSATRDGLKLNALRDLSSYALCARTHIQLGRKVTFNGVVEVPDAMLLREHFSTPTASSESPSAATTTPSTTNSNNNTEEWYAAHASLRAALPGHHLTATLGKNLDYIESSGDYARVPLALSVDLSSLDRADGLQYRVGVHQVSAYPTELSPHTKSDGGGGGTGSGNGSGSNGGGNKSKRGGIGGFSGRRRTVLHAQGAVAVEGEAYMWRGAGGSTAAAAAADKNSTTTSGNTAKGGVGAQLTAAAPIVKIDEEVEEEVAAESDEIVNERASNSNSSFQEALLRSNGAKEEPTTTTNTNNSSSTPVPMSIGGEGESSQQHLMAGESNSPLEEGLNRSTSTPTITTTTTTTTTTAAAAVAAVPSSSADYVSLKSFTRPLELKFGDTRGSHIADAPGTHPASSHPSQEEEQQTQDAVPSTAVVPLPRHIPITSQSVSTAIADSLLALRKLKETVSRVTSDVQDGSLQRLSEQLSIRQPQRRRPYSMLLAQPHMKLNAAMGCLARMPLPPLRALAPGQNGADHSNTTSFYGPAPFGSHHRRTASTSSMASRASISSQLAETWEPYLKGTALRLFASAGISGQLGRFTRPVFDYTAASMRLDVGLSSPHVLGSVPGPGAVSSALDETNRPDKHRAFALEGRGSWHALSVSVAQQVLGPVRARADFRFALDPTNVPQDQGERSTLKGLAQTALSVRPSLLEAVYGVDMVLPGTEGAGRVAVWWSPKRREAMAELRLF